MKGIIIFTILLCSGCASMEASLSPEFRYGQLYGLKEALNNAASQCDSSDAAFTAHYWATTTAHSLKMHAGYLKAGSPQRAQSDELVGQLYALRPANLESAQRCSHFAQAYQTTDRLISLLSN